MPCSDHEPHPLGGQPCLETSKGWLPRDCGGSLSTTTCFLSPNPPPPPLHVFQRLMLTYNHPANERELAALWHLPISLSAQVRLTGSSSRLSSLPPRHLQTQCFCFFQCSVVAFSKFSCLETFPQLAMLPFVHVIIEREDHKAFITH